MKEELIKYILELINEDDCLCVELYEDSNEREYCEQNCQILNEDCVRRLMNYRMKNKQKQKK